MPDRFSDVASDGAVGFTGDHPGYSVGRANDDEEAAMTSTRRTGPTPSNKLDKNVPTAFIWRLTLLATLGGFLFGYDTSNIGSALAFIPYQLNSFATGYLVAGASLGAAAGALLAGPLTDRFGRKKLLVVDALIYAIGALLCAFTWHVSILMIARTLIGIAIGADSAIATAYISEYAPKKRRGSLAMLQQWMITVGILFAYLVALLILKVWPNASDVDWRWFFGIGAIPAIVGLFLRVEMPESPRWLIRKGRYDEAQEAFAKLGRRRDRRGCRVHRARARAGRRQGRPGQAQGLDAGRAPCRLRRVHLLRLPADHRHQRAALLRTGAARVSTCRAATRWSPRRRPPSRSPRS